MTAPQQLRFWSVTTLIKNGTPADALIGWAAKVVAEAAVDGHKAVAAMLEAGDRAGALDHLKGARWRTLKKASVRGSSMHAVAEAYALGTTHPELTPEVVPFVEQYRRFLAEHAPRYIAAEAPVYNLDYHYAGTLDSIAEIGGKTVLLDIKTHEKDAEARSRPPYPDIALQLVAYSRAQLLGLSAAAERGNQQGGRYYIYDPALTYAAMPKLDGALALAISPWEYRLVPVRVDDEVWDTFLHVREVARWTLDISKRVLGPPITPTVEATT